MSVRFEIVLRTPNKGTRRPRRIHPPFPGGNYRYIRCVSCWSEADEYGRKCASNDTEPAISITGRFTGDGGSNFKYTLSNNLLEHFLNLLQVDLAEFLYYPTCKEIAYRVENSRKIRLFNPQKTFNFNLGKLIGILLGMDLIRSLGGKSTQRRNLQCH